MYAFNKVCNNIAASYLKVGGDSMSAIRFWVMDKGNLPHFPYIFRKPEPLVTDFNTFTCSIIGALLFVEVHRIK